MTAIILYMISLLSAPIEKFWIMAEKYKENQEYGKMVAAFAASILIVAGMLVTFVVIIYLLVTYCFEFLLLIGVIIWIYWAVWKKMHDKPQDDKVEKVMMTGIDKLHESAHKGYAPMRTIMFQTMKRSASDIMGKTPRAIEEIEVIGDKYIVENGMVFYQFQLLKSDIKYQCTLEDIEEFKIILQTTFEQLWQSGNFPQIALQMRTDSSGNIYDPVIIDRIDDLGNKYLVQVVYTTNGYMDQMKNYVENKVGNLDTIYNLEDDNFL